MRKFIISAGLAGGVLLGSLDAGAAEMGLYAGPGCDGLTHLTNYAAWLGAPAHHVTENLNQSSWSALASHAQWSIGLLCHGAQHGLLHLFDPDAAGGWRLDFGQGGRRRL